MKENQEKENRETPGAVSVPSRQDEVVRVRNLVKTYGAKGFQTKVLKGIDLTIHKQDFIAIMGPSGSGKTTLLNILSTIDKPTQGTVMLDGRDITHASNKELSKLRRDKIGFVFQDFMLLDGLTIRENILVPRIVQGEVPGEAEKLADQLAAMFGIGHILNKYPAEISGGEKQRAAVARSLINNPLIILADEPTGNLDSKSSRAVIETFINAKQKMNATIFMVTHDSFAASFCDRVILLKDGTIYRQMEKWEDRSVFQDQLLDAIKQMSE